MARLITLRSFSDDRGSLSVIEGGEMPFQIKRVFYIYDLSHSSRAGHRHKTTWLTLICLQGSCRVHVNNGIEISNYQLNHPNNGLVLEPADWHLLHDFSPQTILLVLASEEFHKEEYIFDKYLNESTVS